MSWRDLHNHPDYVDLFRDPASPLGRIQAAATRRLLDGPGVDPHELGLDRGRLSLISLLHPTQLREVPDGAKPESAPRHHGRAPWIPEGV